MIKKIVFFIFLYALSMLPWIPVYIAKNPVVKEIAWLLGAVFSLPLLLLLIRKSKMIPSHQLSMRDRPWKHHIGPGFIIGLSGFILYFGLRWLLGGFIVENTLPLMQLIPTLLMTLIYTLYIAITEEFIYRGYLLSAMREAMTLSHAILLSIGIFLLGHLPQGHHLLHSPYAVHIVTMGLVFTYAYLCTGSIWLGIGIHWGWNMGGFTEDRVLILDHKTMSSWGNPLSWIYIAVDLLLLLMIMQRYGRNKRRSFTNDTPS
ncbi:CPBP family intramembrane glutamic endopeptidase [Paenibacillus paeoniae]|uniref:CPBP family intramembrane metalloprotease n=1 Tax=Paenibacillus paeoniae TaxID=2292705 RepID=A0A371PHJ6_9BACL|nr:type II CAAX endopeptidase family protein [Paenibacillus paeoniae]REK74998.1 CPBP family intramembrane metalloprotease [Paenibacillus paeoniae]